MKTYSTSEVVLRLKSFLRSYRKLIVITCIGNLLTVCIAMTPPLFAKFLIDEALPSQNTALVVGVAITFLCLTAVQHVVGYGHYFLQNYIGQKVVFDIRKKLFHHLQLLHLSFYEQEKTASIVNRLIHDVGAIQQFIGMSFASLTNSGISFLISIAIMLFLNLKLTLLCLTSLPIYFLITHHFRKKIYQMSHDIKDRQSAMAGSLGETFSGIKIVKSFAQEHHECKRFLTMIKDNFYPEFDLTMAGHRMGIALNSLCIGVYVMVMIVGGITVIQQKMSVGAYVAYTSYLWMLFGPLQTLSALMQMTLHARTGFERVLSILDTHPEVIQANDAIISTLQGRVTFEEVSFQYQDRTTIQQFSLDVKPGEIIALVGPSGSGKSTLMSLLTRFYEVDSGRILIDGTDLRQLDYDHYRRQISIVLQDSFLFSGSVEENIRYGKPDASMTEIHKAAEMAYALNFIEQMPNGFKSKVGQSGVTLSGGQRQRIAIARAILKNPKILIFDEATSALDTESEMMIQKAMDSLMQNKTVFIVAHRLTTIQKAHRIVVLDKGRVAEIGRHDELLSQRGIYHRLYHPRLVVDRVAA